MEASRRYISGAAKPGVYIGRMKLPSLLSTSRAAPKSISTDLLSSVMKDIGRLDVQMQHLVLVNDAQTAQDFVKQRADGGLAEHLLLLQIARGDDEILQAAPSR
jgi:hypothetical protein